jgi:hypothetical protein
VTHHIARVPVAINEGAQDLLSRFGEPKKPRTKRRKLTSHLVLVWHKGHFYPDDTIFQPGSLHDPFGPNPRAFEKSAVLGVEVRHLSEPR